MTQGDPATPRFDAAEPTVAATPFGRIGEEHPLRRALGTVEFPAARERVLFAVGDDPRVDAEQTRWLTATLPDRTFTSADDVVRSLGAWGPPPPAASASL